MRILVMGAGGVGSHCAAALARLGHDVVLGSRSGSSPASDPSGAGGDGGERVRPVAVDASDAAALVSAADGADVIVNAVNPPYTKWAELWPPMAAAFLAAAERTGAGLVTFGNLYSYGHVSAPMTEGTPVRPNGAKGQVRGRMWSHALAAHDAGRARVVEVRASDYFGPGATRGTSVLNSYVVEPAARGRIGRPPMGDAHAPHSWTYLPDIGDMLAAVALSDPDGADWGRAWHVPTAAVRSMAEVARDVAVLCGKPDRGVRPWPGWLRTLLHPVVPVIRELDETAHQFERPFVLDSSAAQERFGLAPTPWEEALGDTLAALS